MSSYKKLLQLPYYRSLIAKKGSTYFSPIESPAILTQPVADAVFFAITDNKHGMIHASTIIQTAPIRRENARLVKIELVGGKEICNHWLLTKHSLHFIHIPVVDPVVVADFERESV